MREANIRSARKALTALYDSHRPLLPQYAWESEVERWNEFVTVLLTEGVGIDLRTARRAVHVLGELGVLSCSALAAANGSTKQLVQTTLIQLGVRAPTAREAVKLLTTTARSVEKKWGGHIQRLLRSHARLMMEDVARTLSDSSLTRTRKNKVAAMWLQNVANMPILLPEDAHIRLFCRAHGISDTELIQLADAADLNLAVLDDILTLEQSVSRGRSKDRHAPRPSIGTILPQRISDDSVQASTS